MALVHSLLHKHRAKYYVCEFKQKMYISVIMNIMYMHADSS